MTHDFFWKLVDPKKQAKQAAASASGAATPSSVERRLERES